MDTLGSQLKAAREARKATMSEAAEATRMKVQHIEALESCDFSRMPAPIYVKGFIKLYAEFLDLDPQPLVQQYVDHYAPLKNPPLTAEADLPEEEGRASKPPMKWPFKMPELHLGGRQVKLGLLILAGLLILLWLLSGIRSCVMAVEDERPEPAAGMLKSEDYERIDDLPDPYVYEATERIRPAVE